MQNILIPLDGSEFSAQILESIKKFLSPQTNALILFRVGAMTEGHTGLPPRPASMGAEVAVYDTARDIDLEQHPIYASQEADNVRGALRDELESFVQHLRDAGYAVTTEVELGNAAEAIIERARGADIALVAMTTHGRSGISRLLFGSVAEQIVRHVDVPVLLLRPVTKHNA